MRSVFTFWGKKFFEIISKINPKLSCRLLFFIRTHKSLNLRNPKSFNEKTTWLKMYKYKDNDLVIMCSDKYEVRKYIEKKGQNSILNELYGVYDNFDEINFDELPDKFVIKCTHGCSYNIICDNKSNFDISSARRKINKWLKEKYGYATTELHYTRIKPRIIIEKYLCDNKGNMPVDYKFYCFNGKVECILVCSEREKKLRLSYYDLNWKRINYETKKWSSKVNVRKPKKLDEMINIAQILSKEFPFVRVDLYNDNGCIIFGELTFTPACCCAPYYTKEANVSLGERLMIKDE